MLIKDTPEARAIYSSCWLDGEKYAKYFYAGRFHRPFSEGQKLQLRAINSRIKLPDGTLIPKYNKLNIISWRGGGKSTISKTTLAQRLRYADTMFAVYLGKSHDFSSLQTENVKRGMLQNKRETEIFGPLKPTTNSGIQETFSKKSWMTSTGALVWPRGCGQPVRGLLHDFGEESYRPGLILIDDLMDKQFIDSEQYRNDTFKWIITDVAESVPPPEVSMNWQIIYIDTLKHSDAANERLSESPDWKTIRIPLADDNLRSLAPGFYTDEQVRKKYDAFLARGEQNLFFQEFMCTAVSGKDAVFQTAHFKYYEENDAEFLEELKRGEIENVILVDPAKSLADNAALSAIVGVGVNTVKNKIYVRDIDAGRWTPDVLYDKVFGMAQRLRPCHVIGLEINSLSEFIRQPFLNEMNRRGLYYELVELKPRRMPAESSDKTHGKRGRVGGLEPYYRQGLIYHNKACCIGLEAQLLSFPHPKRWDIMDAFAYIVQILEMGLRFFEGPEKDEDDDRADEEAEEREYIKMMEEDDEPLQMEEWI